MFVESLARPGSNATGFSTGEFGTSAKWLELLKEIAPSITQVGILHDAQNPSSIPQFAAMQSLAPSLGVELKSLPLRDVDEIDRIVAAFARGSNLGLIATRIGAAISQRDLIIALAARHRLPAVYPLRFFVTGGGLASYGPDIVDQYRRAAVYVDRILKGERPADLPVQAPTKYESGGRRPRPCARRRGGGIDGPEWEIEMKLPRRQFLHLAAGAAALPAVARRQGASYPTRPVRIVSVCGGWCARHPCTADSGCPTILASHLSSGTARAAANRHRSRRARASRWPYAVDLHGERTRRFLKDNYNFCVTPPRSGISREPLGMKVHVSSQDRFRVHYVCEGQSGKVSYGSPGSVRFTWLVSYLSSWPISACRFAVRRRR
jgi:hypothetical protein